MRKNPEKDLVGKWAALSQIYSKYSLQYWLHRYGTSGRVFEWSSSKSLYVKKFHIESSGEVGSSPTDVFNIGNTGKGRVRESASVHPNRSFWCMMLGL